MSPAGYLRGSEEQKVAPWTSEGTRTVPRSILLALVFLAMAQVGCTLGIFLYFKAQIDPTRTSDKEMQCWRRILKTADLSHSEEPLQDGDNNLHLCDTVRKAFNAAVQKAVQGMGPERQVQSGNALKNASYTLRDNNPQKWPSAHLTIHNITSREHTKVNLTSWNYKEGWANLQNMSYNKGKLKVLRDGFYFVYANLCFRHHISSAKTLYNKALQFMLYVCKANKNRSHLQTLMKGGNTEVWSNNSDYHFYSIYQGGIFKLQADEEILIQATYSPLLDLAQEATYFGAFRIADQHV
ncbi:tumor necrosis factor ligand superfamily member 11 [Pelodytes ibericus]